MKNKSFKIIICSRCGDANKVINMKHYLYNEHCRKCGKILEKGKYGGKSDYADYLKTKHWQTTKRLALEHYGNICSVCGTDKKLNVHHVSYKNRGKEKLSDLMILCKKHHEGVHGREQDCVNI